MGHNVGLDHVDAGQAGSLAVAAQGVQVATKIGLGQDECGDGTADHKDEDDAWDHTEHIELRDALKAVGQAVYDGSAHCQIAHTGPHIVDGHGHDEHGGLKQLGQNGVQDAGGHREQDAYHDGYRDGHTLEEQGSYDQGDHRHTGGHGQINIARDQHHGHAAGQYAGNAGLLQDVQQSVGGKKRIRRGNGERDHHDGQQEHHTEFLPKSKKLVHSFVSSFLKLSRRRPATVSSPG